jgi:hypothetical protein
VPRPATGDGLGLLRQRCGPLPAADCRAGRSSSVWASSFLLTASNSICSPWITGPYNMHATALSALIEWGRMHEVRRSQPKLSGPLILEFGVSSPPRASPDSYLWPTSHISWTVFFADRLAWFRAPSYGGWGQFQSWRGDRIYCSRCAHYWGSICEVPVLLKSGGRRPFAMAVCRCDGVNLATS